MSGLINWWRSFGPDFEKDVLKILLDKGALALVVAFAGFVFARALERYKAAEARKTEITKLQFPLIQELIKDANNLAILAIETMEIELRRYEEWKPWLSNLEKANVIDIDLANNELPILQHKLSNGQLLRDHLLSCSPSHSINMALANYDFAQSEHFLRILTTWYYSTSFQRPLNDCMLQHQFLENVFWRLSASDRTKYNESLQVFSIKCAAILAGVDNEEQERIGKCLEILERTVRLYPLSTLSDVDAKRVIVDIQTALIVTFDKIMRKAK